MQSDEDLGEWHLPFYLFVTKYRRCKLHQSIDDQSLPVMHRLQQFKELFDIGVFPDPILDRTQALPPFLKSIAPIENRVRWMRLAVL